MILTVGMRLIWAIGPIRQFTVFVAAVCLTALCRLKVAIIIMVACLVM